MSADNQIAKNKIKAPQQYFVALFLPPNMSENDVQMLADNCGESLAVITDLLDDREPNTWRIRWLVQTIPNTSLWADAINSLAKSFALNDMAECQSSDFVIEDVPDINWVEQSLEQFKPFEIGDFLIYGSAHKDIAEQSELVGLHINATTAFGTGQHPTTEGCLKALYDYVAAGNSPQNILDMGTGTGILAIAAAKRLPQADILAIDNDAESIDVTHEHIELNKCENIKAYVGDGFDCEHVKSADAFNCILANILARPLRDMAPDLVACLSDEGVAILSGLLQTQSADVEKAYKEQGLILLTRYDIEDWSTLVFKRGEP